MHIDRGAYPDASTPWEDPAWRSEALDWLGARLEEAGIRETGPRRVRVRPWSIIVRVEAAGPVWFKAASPPSAFEAGLGEALARWAPSHVLTPYAVDAARGWSLLPSGGPLMRTLEVGAREWEEALTQYADLQRAVVPHVSEMLGLGVPDLRMEAVPRVFDEAVAGAVLDDAERARLEVFRPRLVEWCSELTAIGVPDSLDHADLHDGQILVPGPGRYTFFDWGDANVGQPFCSLLIALEKATDSQMASRLEDAYLEAWTGDFTLRELRRAAELARRLSQLTRAGSWTRLFPGAAEIGKPEQAAALLRLTE
jgi:hypothetical protein